MFNIRRFRPLGLADLFDEAFDLYKSNFLLFLGASAIFTVPLQIAIIAVVNPALENFLHMASSTSPDFDQIMTMMSQAVSVLLIGSTLNLIAVAIVGTGLVYIISERYHNRPVTIIQGYLAALRRSLPVVFTVILVTAIISLGSFACLIPGMYFSCRYLLASQVAVLEKANSPFAILRRSYKLTENGFWRCAGCLSLLSLIHFVMTWAAQAPLEFVLAYLPIDSLPFLPALAANKAIASEIAASFATLIVSPYSFTLLTLMYFDFRIRQEGYDMVVIAEQLGMGDDSNASHPSAKAPGQVAKRRFWQRPQKGQSAA